MGLGELGLVMGELGVVPGGAPPYDLDFSLAQNSQYIPLFLGWSI